MEPDLDETKGIEHIIKISDDNTKINEAIIYKEDTLKVFFEQKGFIVKNGWGGEGNFHGYEIREKKVEPHKFFSFLNKKIEYEIAYINLHMQGLFHNFTPVSVYGNENMGRLRALLMEYNKLVKSKNGTQNNKMKCYKYYSTDGGDDGKSLAFKLILEKSVPRKKLMSIRYSLANKK